MEVRLFIGDIDEFYCDAVPGDRRAAVWSQTTVPLDANHPARDRGAMGKVVTTLIARFETFEEAEQFVENYDVGAGNTKVLA